jgi:hypothetical protein
LASLRFGSRKQSPPIPDDAAWHCAMLSKPQPVICPVTSWRQNSAALASGAIAAPKASAASNAAAGAVAAFKSSFIMLSLFFLVSAPAPSRSAISGIGEPHSSIKHQSILKYDNHMKEPCRHRATRRLIVDHFRVEIRKHFHSRLIAVWLYVEDRLRLSCRNFVLCGGYANLEG